MEKEIRINLSFTSPEEAATSRKNFKEFCESLTSKLRGKGSHSFFESATKQVSFESALFDKNRLPEPPKNEPGLWAAIESHSNRLMGKNGHSKKDNKFLDIFKSREK